MVSVVVSGLVAVAGLYLVLSGRTEAMAFIGWMLLVVGALGVVANLYLRRRGITSPRRWR